MKIIRILASLSLVLFIVSCSKKEPHFVLEGVVAGADSTMLYLEKRELDKTTIVDSLRLSASGQFKFAAPASQTPEFYLLKLNNQIINLAIDSTETVKIEASKKDFATSYKVEGSEINQKIQELTLAQYKANSSIAELQQKLGKQEITENEYLQQLNNIAEQYRTLASKIIFEDLKSSAAYFALFQKVNDYLFYDPYNKNDYKVFAAVATTWDFYYPESARSKQLKQFTLEALKVRKQEEAPAIDLDNATVDSKEYFNIELPNIENKQVSLSSLKGKVVVVDFTSYQLAESPAHNIMLNTLYEKYKDRIEIYQVSFDTDKHLWQNGASNIPWIAVYDSRSLNSPLVSKFNIQALPAIYLFDKEGELVNRIESLKTLEQEIGKLI